MLLVSHFRRMDTDTLNAELNSDAPGWHNEFYAQHSICPSHIHFQRSLRAHFQMRGRLD